MSSNKTEKVDNKMSRRQVLHASLATTASVIGGSLLLHPSQSAYAATTYLTSWLRPKQFLVPFPKQNQYNGVISHNGTFLLIMQADGNLVLYIVGSTQALWASNTAGTAVQGCIMQADGNLVIYGYNEAVWASGTDGYYNSSLTVQDDGNVVIYDRYGYARWATGTQARP